jgi:hypothetical protein
MAKQKPKNTAALAADEGNPIPRISLTEQGYTGLRIVAKNILEEKQRTFQPGPALWQVREEMLLNSTVATAFNVYKMLMARVDWKVCPPKDATDIEKERAAFVQSCMDDMEGSWTSFMTEVLPYLEYGYSVVEKVYRRRLKKNGSKHNDGLVGIKKLAPRGQETITKWYFSDDGRELLAVGQNMNFMVNASRFSVKLNDDGVVELPREKVMIFTADGTKSNPQGKSLLRCVFLPYKQLSLLKDQLMLGVSKDLQGIPYFQIPAKFLDPNASPEDKAVYESFKTIVNGLAEGTQKGVILPKILDPQTNEDLVSLQLLEAKGGKAFDIPSIIAGLQTDILTALSVDVVQLGNGGAHGSFSLASSKQNLLSMAIEFRLKEIQEVLNTDLMKQLYEMNGWDTDRMCKFDYSDIIDLDMEEISKFIQRCASTGMLVKDHATINKIREAMGVAPIPEDTNLDDLEFTGNGSRAGDGMATEGEGTSKSPSGKDSSSSNSENAA